ncbi:helix-turn-helix domain-containing protein [Amycolatopsis sp. NPDC004747]
MSRRDRDRVPDCMLRGPGRPGTPLIAERAACFGLVEGGVGTWEAARRIGVSYRTAKRWRAEAAQS